jgi:peptide/nickel transport system substrate-binding protein
MKSRILLILLTVMLALSLGLTGCGGEQVPEYNLTISSTEGGSVTDPGEGASTYDEGDEVDLLAEAQDGYEFVSWTGHVDTIDDVNAASTTITMNGDYSITANFIAQYVLTIGSTVGGEVTTPGEGVFTYDEPTVINLVAEPDEDCRFVNWTGDVSTIANADNARTTINVDSRYSVTANFACGPAIPLKNPGRFVQMTIGDVEVESLDPAWVWDDASAEQVGHIYETLIYYDREKIDEFVPVLATEWEFLDDDVTYRFKIRDGVRFHEGGDLTPSDVEYSFKRAMVQDRCVEFYAPSGPIWVLYQPLLGLVSSRDDDGDIQVTFDQIDSAVEVDGDWVVFHLIDPAWALPFLQILSQPVWSSAPAIVDKEWCIANGEWDGTEETWEYYNNPGIGESYLYNHTNGTGPWKLEEWDPGVQIELARNDNYWREPAAFETVITKFVEDWTTRKEALLAGDADLVVVPRANIGELDGITDLNVFQDLLALSTSAFFFNFDIASDSEYTGSGALDGNGIPTDFFTDIDVRKGFNHAFDWETYIDDALMGEAEQRGSPVLEGLPFYDPDASMYSLDLAKAEEHLRAAWDGEVWEKGFKFTLPYNAGGLVRETACKILAENLAAINSKLQVSVQPIDGGIYFDKIWGTRDMPMFQIGWTADYPHPDNLVVPFMASYGFFAELQSYGYPEFDELIEDAFEELDPSAQQNMYYELQERYYEDAPSIMLYQPLGRRYFTKYIEGFYFNPMIPGQAGPLYYMSKSES